MSTTKLYRIEDKPREGLVTKPVSRCRGRGLGYLGGLSSAFSCDHAEHPALGKRSPIVAQTVFLA